MDYFDKNYLFGKVDGVNVFWFHFLLYVCVSFDQQCELCSTVVLVSSNSFLCFSPIETDQLIVHKSKLTVLLYYYVQ